MKRGLILLNAYMATPNYLFQANRLQEELALLGVETDVKRNDKFFSLIQDGKIKNGLNYDFCIYLDKDKYMSLMLEKSGLRLFNRHEPIRICDDKMDTFLYLADKNIPMPKTLSGILCYDPSAKVSKESLTRVEEELAYPIVVKECYGSLGKGVYLAQDRAELALLAERVKCRPHLFQEYVHSSVGKDVRVIVIGGKAVCAMLRSSDADFRSNIELGGKGTPFVLTEDFKGLAEKCAQEIGLDYCGVDLMFGENGPMVCEVNSNAFFGGIERVTGYNVARAYAQYIMEKTYR